MAKPVSWREMITSEIIQHGDSWNNVEACTLSDAALDIKFDNDYGGTQGQPFTLWTKDRVYFPVQYDGAEWVASVSRAPDGKATEHVGG